MEYITKEFILDLARKGELTYTRLNDYIELTNDYSLDLLYEIAYDDTEEYDDDSNAIYYNDYSEMEIE